MSLRVRLEQPSVECTVEFLEAVRRSRRLHGHWARPPRTPEEFGAYIRRLGGPTHIGHFVRTQAGPLAGVININEIVRASFQSAYLGYYAFVPYNAHGYMTAALRLVLKSAFRRHRLHRLEANIQPDNVASLRLVRRLGFHKEGYSPRYLKLGGRWRDHERWAITVEDWQASR